MTGARNQINEATHQLYLHRCLALNCPASQVQEHLTSANAYELKSILNIVPS